MKVNDGQVQVRALAGNLPNVQYLIGMTSNLLRPRRTQRTPSLTRMARDVALLLAVIAVSVLFPAPAHCVSDNPVARPSPPTANPPTDPPQTAPPPTAPSPTALPPTAPSPTALPPTAPSPTALPPTAPSPTALPPTTNAADCPQSPAGSDNNNGSGNGNSGDVTAIYNDAEYPFCPNCTCPDLYGMCDNGMCSDTSGKFGRWRLPDQSSLTCPPSQSDIKANEEWCYSTTDHSITPKECCNKCREVGPTYCTFWQHYVGITNPGSTDINGVCWLYPYGTGEGNNRPTPTCETNVDINNGYRIKNNCSQVGRNCVIIDNDPHFYGADGTRFEFNGLPDRTFCLLTEKNYHVNMKMHGYYDSRTVGASILHNGKAVRTWIRELGVVYKSAEGQEHKLHLAARAGTQQERGDGYLASALLDGEELPVKGMQEGDVLELAGGLKLTFIGIDSKGHYVMDHYHVSLPGQFSIDLKLRLAHPLLQTPDDAETHFNVAFEVVSATETTHGVMGQTYRKGRQSRAMDYKALAALLHHPVAADGEMGNGYLDGKVDDYVTADILSTDCRFSAYATGSLPQ